MFDFFKKKKNNDIQKKSKNDIVEYVEENDESDKKSDIASSLSAVEASVSSVNMANKRFAKPENYTGNRKLYDSGAAKVNAKKSAFSSAIEVKDPYTGETLVLTKSEAKLKFGQDWQKHLAESDHKVPVEKVHSDNKNNPWLDNDDIKNLVNDESNIEVVSRKYNNAKRSRTNKELVEDDEYLKKTGLELTKEGKKRAIETGEKSQREINVKAKVKTVKNIAKTGHSAGVQSAKHSAGTSATISTITNIVDVVQGNKTPEEAIKDTAVSTGKAAATGYVMGNGLTVINHTLSSSSSKVISSLAKSNVPGKVITAIMVTGDTFKRYSNGEINTEECILELGKSGLSVATAGYSMAVGQALIPIPIVGAAVGAFIGQALTCNAYDNLIFKLKNKQLEHQERLRIMQECEYVKEQQLFYQEQLSEYLDAYFGEYKTCFNDAISQISIGFESGDADVIIAGANKITEKLGGRTQYDNVEEFKDFLDSNEDFML